MMDFPGHVTRHAHLFYLIWSKITPLLKDLTFKIYLVFFMYDNKYKVYGTDWGFWKLINCNIFILEGEWGK